MRTVPVKYSTGPFAEGCAALLVISIFLLRLLKNAVSLFSKTSHSLQFFGISPALDQDLCGSVVDFTKIVCRKFDYRSSDVFLKTGEFRRTRDWNNPGFLN